MHNQNNLNKKDLSLYHKILISFNSKEELLLDCAKDNNVELFEHLLDANLNVNYVDEYGML